MPKIEEAELKQINELRSKLDLVVGESGQHALRLELLKVDVSETQTKLEEKAKEFKQLLIQEEELINRLSEKYGTGSIDFETGEFTPEK